MPALLTVVTSAPPVSYRYSAATVPPDAVVPRYGRARHRRHAVALRVIVVPHPLVQNRRYPVLRVVAVAVLPVSRHVARRVIHHARPRRPVLHGRQEAPFVA